MWVFCLFLVSVNLAITGAKGSVTSWRGCSSFRGSTDCRNRKLESVPKDIFRAIHRSVFLARNPYDCNCDMTWFLKKVYLKSYAKFVLDLKHMTCDKPAHLKGKKIYQLREDDVCPRTEDSCHKGYVKKNMTCEDVDECQDGTATCHRRATCENIPGDYQCTCKGGYYSGKGVRCVGKAGTGCSGRAQGLCNGFGEECLDRARSGEFICACRSGFTRKSADGVCKDINECSRKSRCGRMAKCINTVGSYTCLCPKGYWSHWDKCVDTDECAFRENDCHRDAVCINTVGSYSCKCRTGFEDYKDGRLCLKEEDQEEEFDMLPIIVGSCIVVFLAIALIACILYKRKNRKQKKAIEKKPLVKGKRRKNWLSTFMFPEANINTVPGGDSAITVWSDSDEE